MSSIQVGRESATEIGEAETVDMKLEVVVVPVSDVDGRSVSRDVPRPRPARRAERHHPALPHLLEIYLAALKARSGEIAAALQPVGQERVT
jgi:hypothetical protein